jgi:tripartite-type tricarboxylate transporter receptor subunit TctC
MHVVSATPDGYTLGWFIDVFQTPEMYTYFRGKPSYTSNDLKPISSLFSSLQSLAVKADAPWKNFAELIAYSRNNRGLKFGSNPEGSGPNLMMRIVSKKEDLDWKAVPLNDDPVILTNLLGGNVPMGTVGYSTVKPQLNAGNVRILVVFSDKRLTGAPEFPTIGECGYPLAYTPSTGVFAPKGVPDSVVRKLETTVKKVIEDASFREKIREIGFPISYRDSNELTELTARNKISLEKVFREFGYWK